MIIITNFDDKEPDDTFVFIVEDRIILLIDGFSNLIFFVLWNAVSSSDSVKSIISESTMFNDFSGEISDLITTDVELLIFNEGLLLIFIGFFMKSCDGLIVLGENDC